MARLDDWENIIAAEVNGAPLPTMMDAVRAAAIEFCQRTSIDTRIVGPIDYEAAHPDVPVPDADPDTTPSSVMTLWTTFGKLEPATKRDLEQLYPNGWAAEAVDTTYLVRRWYSPRPGVVRLVPRVTVDMAAELTLDVAFQPKRNAIEVADFLYEKYANEIGAGAIAALHSHSQAPYAQPERVSAYRMIFERRIATLADKGVAGHQKARHRVRTDELS